MAKSIEMRRRGGGADLDEPKEPCIRWGLDFPTGRGNFGGFPAY